VVAILAATAPVSAQDAAAKTELHGYGTWSYGRTNANAYLGGLPGGDYRTAQFALNVTGVVGEHLRVVAQPFFTESASALETKLDIVFAEWKFSDALRLRAGKARLPFGISTEVFDVGTLRPFVALPQAVYGEAGMVAEGYKGVGLRGERAFGRWSVAYDVYAGGIEFEELEPEKLLEGPPGGELTNRQTVRNMVGGRLVLETAVRGLRVGASALTGTHMDDGKRHTSTGGLAEYLSDAWSLRSELVREVETGKEKLNSFYVEAARRLDSHWQVASQYGRLSRRLLGEDVSLVPSFGRHREWAVGANYWFSPALVFKLSYHKVDGNLLALPQGEELGAPFEPGRLRTRTTLVLFGAQFSF
jgi:hypothetical protein